MAKFSAAPLGDKSNVCGFGHSGPQPFKKL